MDDTDDEILMTYEHTASKNLGTTTSGVQSTVSLFRRKMHV